MKLRGGDPALRDHADATDLQMVRIVRECEETRDPEKSDRRKTHDAAAYGQNVDLKYHF